MAKRERAGNGHEGLGGRFENSAQQPPQHPVARQGLFRDRALRNVALKLSN